MRTLYRDQSVLVTDTIFRVTGRSSRSVEIARLKRVYIVRVTVPSGSRQLRHSWPALVSSVTSIAVATYGLHSHGWQQVLFLTGALCLIATLSIGAKRGCTAHELWAVTDASHFCLYRTIDARAFEQIRRAVIRAREQLPNEG